MVEMEPFKNPAFARVYHGKGNALRELGNMKQAADSYRKAIRLDPDFGGPLWTLVPCCKAWTVTGALANYSRAIELDPDKSDTYILRAEVYGSIGDYEHEISDYSRAIELAQDLGEAYFCRGISEKKSGPGA